jgi:plasmid stability protein
VLDDRGDRGLPGFELCLSCSPVRAIVTSRHHSVPDGNSICRGLNCSELVTAHQIIDFNAIKAYNDFVQTGEATTPMSSITIRNLDPAVKERLRVRAAEHGHSMEAEARRILQSALHVPARKQARSLYDRIHDRFAAIGGVDLELPPREPGREPPRFD